MLPYILHVSILLAGSYLFYVLFLGKETFFQLNRWVLIGCILTAFALPFLEIPEEWSFRQNTEIVLVENPVFEPIIQEPVLGISNEPKATHSIDNQMITPSKQSENLVEIPQKSSWNWALILKYIYVSGLAIFGLNFLLQLVVLLVQIISNPKIKDGPFRIIEMNKDKAPFSFLNNIFLNPTKYDWDTYNQILEHEKIHIKGRHTLDILIAELMVIVQWFNPFAWLYRKAVEHNLEYLTDGKMLKEGTDKKAYQMNLLKVSVPNLPLNLTTNYNQSILKKRILMMNAKKSSVRSGWKYFFILPALGLSVICLNAVKISAKQLIDNEQIEQKIYDSESPDLQQNDPPKIQTQTPQKEEKLVIKSGDWNIVAQNMTIYGQAIPPVGTWTANVDGNEICIQFKSEEIKGNWWARHVCFDKSEFKNLPTDGNSTFSLERDAGSIQFEGNLNSNKGGGTFSFKENPTFKSWMVSQGYAKVTEKTLFNFALSDIGKSYVNFIKEQGYNPTLEELDALAVHGATKEKVKDYIDKTKKLGIEKITLRDIIQFEIHDINMDYVLEMKDLLNEDLTVRDVVQAGIHDLSPEYIKSIKSEGYPNMTFREVVQFGIHDIEADYIKSLKSAGLTNLKTQEIVQAAIHDIDAEYLKELKGAGFEDLSFDDIIQFGIHDVDGEYIKDLQAAGLGLTKREMIQAAIHDIDAGYLKELQGAGFEDLNFDEIIQFGIHDVDGEYIKELKASGLNLTQNEMVQAAIHDISAEYLKELKGAGFEDLTFDQVIQFGIHDVDGNYIKELKATGLNLTQNEIVQAAIHDINSEYLKELKGAGFENLSFNEIIQFGIHDVDGEYIKSLKAAGLSDLTTEEMIQAAIHDVQAIEIAEFRALGYTDLDMSEIVQLSIHNADAKFIKSIHNLGFKNASIGDLVQARIHDVDADFIKKAKADGKNYDNLNEYVQLKIQSYEGGNRKRIE